MTTMTNDKSLIDTQYIEETLPPIIIKSPSIPGQDLEKIDANSGIRNIPSGNQYANNVTYTTTGVKTVTGVGFTPKMIEIEAFVPGNGSGHSDGYYYNGNVYCHYFYFSGGVATEGGIGYSSYCQVGANASVTTTITPTTDGFTINVTNVSGGPITIIYKCYS